jgi:hypothetical protein
MSGLLGGFVDQEYIPIVTWIIIAAVGLAVIYAAYRIFRILTSGTFISGGRNRRARLAVMDATAVDDKRRLVLVRRDDVEHLILIGGPTDVVVETHIVRTSATAMRDAPVARNGGDDIMPRAMPLPEPSRWPIQPDPAHPARTDRAPRIVADEPSHWHAQAEPAPPVRATRPADALAGLAAELSHQAPAAQPQPAAAATPQPAAPTDQSLAEMAHRLEAALRRPSAQKAAGEAGAARVAVVAEAKPAARAEPRVTVVQDTGGAQPAAQPKPQPSAQPNNLEQEMASLLGRTGKA